MSELRIQSQPPMNPVDSVPTEFNARDKDRNQKNRKKKKQKASHRIVQDDLVEVSSETVLTEADMGISKKTKPSKKGRRIDIRV